MWHQRLIDLMAAEWRGPFGFYRFSESAPHPPVPQSSMRRVAPQSAHECQLPPPGCRNTTRVERFSEARYPCGGCGGDLRRFGFAFAAAGSAAGRWTTVTGPPLMARLKSRDSSQVCGGSWCHSPFFACFLTICEILFVESIRLLSCHWHVTGPTLALTRLTEPSRSLDRECSFTCIGARSHREASDWDASRTR
jgi:hypothetical protein